MFGTQFDYLRVSGKTAKSIEHPPSYIKDGQEGLAERRIFRNVYFDEYENAQLGLFKKYIKKYEVPYNPAAQTDDVLLRFLYAGQFNLSTSLEIYKGYMNWLSLNDPFFLTAKAKNVLEEGMIYLAGRDKQYRPSIVINAYLFDFEVFDSDAFLRALYNLLAICEDYMFYPGKIENIIVFLETKEMNLIKFPYRQLQIIILQLQQNFPQMLHKLYLFNPSKSLRATWDYISTLIDSRTLQKIELVKTDLFDPGTNGFDPNQIEERFGGSMINIQQFWMPLSTINQPTRSEPEWRYEQALTYNREQPYDPSKLYDEELMFASHNYKFYREPSLLPEQKQELQELFVQQEQQRQQLESQEDQRNLHGDMQNLFGFSAPRQTNPVSVPLALQQNVERGSQLKPNRVTFMETDSQQQKQTVQPNKFAQSAPMTQGLQQTYPNYPSAQYVQSQMIRTQQSQQGPPTMTKDEQMILALTTPQVRGGSEKSDRQIQQGAQSANFQSAPVICI